MHGMRLSRMMNPITVRSQELAGVYATGKTLEECRANMMEVIDGWIIVRLRRGLPIPPP